MLSEEQLLSWGWRLPFLLSFVLMIFAVWLRLNLKESPVFEERPDVVDGVALSRHEVEARAAETHESVLEAGLKQRKGKAFFLALGLRFGQAGNSGLVQTFLVGYIATTLLVDQDRADPGHRVRLAARLRHRPGGRPARRPLRPPPGLHRAEPADRSRSPSR